MKIDDDGAVHVIEAIHMKMKMHSEKLPIFLIMRTKMCEEERPIF